MASIAKHWYCCCSQRTGSLISSVVLLILAAVSSVLYFVALFDTIIGHQVIFNDGFYNAALYIHIVTIFINMVIHVMCSIILFLAIFFEKSAWITCFAGSLLITTLLESTLASITAITFQIQTLPDSRTLLDYPIILTELAICFVKTIFQIHLIISEMCISQKLEPDRRKTKN